ncbi:MAG: type II/IV secretion system protein [Desulfamplus sp.]|nr:type II/IV secretion system protein [Desulfamplus sp.]MBF0390688.1 type II/IV secretion system protein [Desulfamplus sp.]
MVLSKRICSILVNAGIISTDQAKNALQKERITRERIHAEREKKRGAAGTANIIDAPIDFVDVLLALNVRTIDNPEIPIEEDTLYETIAKGLGIAYKKIDPLQLDLNLVTRTIPKSFAMKHLLLPLEINEGQLVVATVDPFNQEAIEDVERVTNLKVLPVISSKSDIKKLISECFGFKHSISAAEDQFASAGVGVDLGNFEQFVRLTSSDEVPSTDQHIVNAVNHLFSYSFDQRASDIHIEPKRDTSIVRMRIDGVLHTVYKLPKKVHNAVISRIKTLSGLNMAEKRRPQDGRIKTEKDGVEVEIRVSTIPVAFGEKAVLRVMDPTVLFQSLEQLGFEDEDYHKYKKMISMPHGIILVTGPTGSGKSTTLYSTLRLLSSPEVNITTIEDPIEMIHEDFNQIAVQPAIEVTFDTVLRNILRQDPDIIMVGEIRDLLTAQSAIQAALTGHLVLSTLHTNDSASSVTRLLDLGIPPFLVHSSLTGIIAQRLVRTICPFCHESFEIEINQLNAMGFKTDKIMRYNGTGLTNNKMKISSDGNIILKRGKGCIHCRYTGYKGRKAVFEVLPYSERLKKMTSDDVNISELRRVAESEGFVSLRDRAIAKMINGETTYQEVLKVTWENI